MRVHVLSEAAEPVVTWVRVSVSSHTPPPPSKVGTHSAIFSFIHTDAAHEFQSYYEKLTES